VAGWLLVTAAGAETVVAAKAKAVVAEGAEAGWEAERRVATGSATVRTAALAALAAEMAKQVSRAAAEVEVEAAAAVEAAVGTGRSSHFLLRGESVEQRPAVRSGHRGPRSAWAMCWRRRRRPSWPRASAAAPASSTGWS
jgi:hypothetical protein